MDWCTALGRVMHCSHLHTITWALDCSNFKWNLSHKFHFVLSVQWLLWICLQPASTNHYSVNKRFKCVCDVIMPCFLFTAVPIYCLLYWMVTFVEAIAVLRFQWSFTYEVLFVLLHNEEHFTANVFSSHRLRHLNVSGTVVDSCGG